MYTRTGMPSLKLIHLVVGIAGLIAFLATGQYMDQWLDHLRGMEDAPRALYRSGHIYLLMSALLNLTAGLYMRDMGTAVARWTQRLGSVLLLAAVGLFLYSFIVETPLAVIERPLVRRAIYWCLSGVLLHGLAVSMDTLRPRFEQAPSSPRDVEPTATLFERE